MPATKPLTSARNFTPSSTELASPASTVAGVVIAGFHRLHGQVTVTVVPAVSVWMLPLSSVARLLSTVLPMPLTSHVYVQFWRPVARRQVAPPSVETSTPAAVPLVSDAVPLIVTVVPDATDALAAGEMIADTGGTTSAVGVAGVRPG